MFLGAAWGTIDRFLGGTEGGGLALLGCVTETHFLSSGAVLEGEMAWICHRRVESAVVGGPGRQPAREYGGEFSIREHTRMAWQGSQACPQPGMPCVGEVPSDHRTEALQFTVTGDVGLHAMITQERLPAHVSRLE